MKLKVIHTPIYNINLLAIFQRGKVSTNLTKTFMFTEESKYTTKNPEDQGDWNKLTGIASLPFNSQKSSHMWAWRYYEGKFQVAPYSHDYNGNIIFPTSDQILIIKVSEKFTVSIDVETDAIFTLTRYRNNAFDNVYFTLQNHLLAKDSYRIITSWFGGTSLPKKTVKIYGC